MLRHRLAFPALTAHRMLSAFATREAGFRILMFHDLPDRCRDGFERLVAHVREVHGTLTPADAAAILQGTAPPPLPRRGRLPCLLTFDDGFASNHRAATDVLDRHGVKGLFFVCPGLMDLGGAVQRDAIAARIFDGRVAASDLAPDLRLMDWDEVHDLAGRGHAIGAHGMTHQRLSKLRGPELEAEILPVGERLAERLGHAADWYAYAFGDVGSITPEALGVIGRAHRFCRSGVRGTNGPATPALGVLADEIDCAAPFAYQQLVLEGGLDPRYREARRELSEMAAVTP